MALEPKTTDFPRIRSALKFYKIASVITGVMLLLLTTEMILKYALQLEFFAFGDPGIFYFAPMNETINGWESSGTGFNLSTGILIAHGWFYVVYLFSDFRLWSLMRWPFSKFIVIALGGVIPLLSFFLEVRIAREVTTYLATRESAESDAAKLEPAA